MVELSQNTNMVLNFLPISISGDSFRAYANKYQSKEVLQQLRKEYANCIFHRIGGDVYCVPVSEGKTIGEEHILKAEENLGIIRKLILEKILGEIIGTGRIITHSFNSFIDIRKNLLDNIPKFEANLSWMRL